LQVREVGGEGRRRRRRRLVGVHLVLGLNMLGYGSFFMFN